MGNEFPKQGFWRHFWSAGEIESVIFVIAIGFIATVVEIFLHAVNYRMLIFMGLFGAVFILVQIIRVLIGYTELSKIRVSLPFRAET